jgi:hypothetical protein
MTQTRYYVNTAAATTSTLVLNNTDSTSTIVVGAALTDWPSLPYTAVLDAGTVSEELILVTNVVGTTVTATRAVHGTAKKAHAIGATFKHCASAQDFTDANAHINAAASVVHAGAFPVLAGGSAGATVNLCVGAISGTTESDGTLVVTHGLGATPDGVLANTSTTGTYLGTVGTFTSTTFKITVFDASDTTVWATLAVAGSFLAWTSS